jgi:hypothetical protein
MVLSVLPVFRSANFKLLVKLLVQIVSCFYFIPSFVFF